MQYLICFLFSRFGNKVSGGVHAVCTLPTRMVKLPLWWRLTLLVGNSILFDLSVANWLLLYLSGGAQAVCTLPTRMVELPCWWPPARGGTTLPSSCWLLVLSLTSRFSQNRNWLFRKEAPASSLKKPNLTFQQDTASDTALILACRNGHRDMVDLLLQK